MQKEMGRSQKRKGKEWKWFEDFQDSAIETSLTIKKPLRGILRKDQHIQSKNSQRNHLYNVNSSTKLNDKSFSQIIWSSKWQSFSRKEEKCKTKIGTSISTWTSYTRSGKESSFKTKNSTPFFWMKPELKSPSSPLKWRLELKSWETTCVKFRRKIQFRLFSTRKTQIYSLWDTGWPKRRRQMISLRWSKKTSNKESSTILTKRKLPNSLAQFFPQKTKSAKSSLKDVNPWM